MATKKITKSPAKKKPAVKKVVETKSEVAVKESTAKAEFRAYMDAYKAKNPVKYAIKEAEFIKQLNQL